MHDIINQYIEFTSQKGYRQVERSNLITPFFKGEFNLSGAHEHLVPAIRSEDKVKKDAISVVDLCVRKVDSEILGYSTSHLLLFEMGVFGQFGYIEDTYEIEEEQIQHLLEILEIFSISKEELLFTICDGGYYIDRNISSDKQTYDILKKQGLADSQIIPTKGRRNFMLSRGIDRLAGYNVEVYALKHDSYLEIASMNIYRYINKLSYLKETVNSGIGCGIGFDRINFYTSDKKSIYQLEPFASIIEKMKEKYGKTNVLLIEDKIVRTIELIKALLYILSDGQKFDKSPQGKTLTTYIARIASEMFYLEIDFDWFYITSINSIRKYYSRYQFNESANVELLEKICSRINKIKTTDN